MVSRWALPLAGALVTALLGGACVHDSASLAPPPCLEGELSCGGRCVDPTLDRNHCGGCGLACPSDQVCSAAACGLECVGGTSRCGDACVDTAVDPAHCGGCDQVCPSGVCTAGTCRCADGTRNGDESDVDCGGACGPCGEGATCVSAGDCANPLRCTSGRCAAVVPPSEGLVAYWPLDGNALDASGNGNDGTVMGATVAPGKVGDAYRITQGACILVPDSASLAMVGGEALTMLAWVRYEGGCAGNGIVLNKEDSYEMSVRCAATPLFQEAIMPSGVTWAWAGTGVVTLGEWQLFAVTWNGTTVRQYLDGVETDSRDMTGQLADRLTGLGIGCRDVGPDGSGEAVGSHFGGVVDEVAVYSRALSAAEVQAYYVASK